MEWVLNTPVVKTFKTTISETIVNTRQDIGVDEDGEPTIISVEEKELVERIEEIPCPADKVRLLTAHNDVAARAFHIRLIYGRLGGDGAFEASIRDDGIVISGPNYANLDTNQDGLISGDELLTMSAKILGWDGELKMDLPVEELA